MSAMLMMYQHTNLEGMGHGTDKDAVGEEHCNIEK